MVLFGGLFFLMILLFDVLLFHVWFVRASIRIWAKFSASVGLMNRVEMEVWEVRANNDSSCFCVSISDNETMEYFRRVFFARLRKIADFQRERGVLRLSVLVRCACFLSSRPSSCLAKSSSAMISLFVC